MPERRSASDYASELRALLPTGAAWPSELEATLHQIIDGMAEEMARLDGTAADLILEAVPHTTFQLLADWERVAGLPGLCRKLSGTFDGRRSDLVAKLNAGATATKQHLIDLAAAAGFIITITEFPGTMFTAGSEAGKTLRAYAPNFIFQVNAPLISTTDFEVGKGAAGEPLGLVVANDDLECLVNQSKPAHTVAIFAYS